MKWLGAGLEEDLGEDSEWVLEEGWPHGWACGQAGVLAEGLVEDSVEGLAEEPSGLSQHPT